MRKEKGAILFAMIPVLSILLMSIGIYVFNTASNTVETASSSMSQQELDIYNAKIKVYVGENVKGSQVKSLLNDIISMNQQNVDEYEKFVSVEYVSSDTSIDTTDLEDACFEAKYDNSEENVEEVAKEIKNLSSEINSGKEYDVSTELDNGRIVTVIITEK